MVAKMKEMIIFFSTLLLVSMLSMQSLTVNSGFKSLAMINSTLIGCMQAVILRMIPNANSDLDIILYIVAGPVGVLLTMLMFPKIKKLLSKDKL